MKTIYLIRHGEIAATSPRRFIGQTNLPLTVKGREQVTLLGKYLSTCGVENIVCSPLLRCQESGQIIAGASGLSIETEDNLSEINLGVWEGLTVDEVKKRYPGAYEQRGEDLAGYRPTDGESFHDLLERVWPAFLQIVEASSSTTAVIAHAGVNRVLLCHILGMPLTRMFTFEQSYAHYNVVSADKTHLKLKALNCSP
ncbi:histidine phosphatase family protein [Desulforhopalus sp. IMCC35007]|uniref:histidine phosphatase family protein n=1 Tax=Desulforhopalus sp. IMCC35007 TaxID=2569543 RepID=UPI0010AE04C6|nr:histidine phosphatase family protein [Desulforhopalus sp. IMCC35007]TKB12360.1 histidine phosphatase family protein [Desulforhopalus sp. IMCC35007]